MKKLKNYCTAFSLMSVFFAALAFSIIEANAFDDTKPQTCRSECQRDLDGVCSIWTVDPEGEPIWGSCVHWRKKDGGSIEPVEIN
ncbi:hypothetical protein [Belliella aquatica]|uniref:Uncharacterized protein n=1 Tax=Belliella aquatica TaxID=1323734 RepID=A0ABQ1MUV6_9BACT|nr:hypothetical protein [Belliella aquatica]MCH7406574.1 hypothetical protein [Belliella aquatica]GGC47015.1 hypothetical protein GCM10010993_27110 [Belliella aquatica]